jgi:hypothetical protein
MTMQDIREANQRTGRFFFSPDTMRFFRSRALSSVYEGVGGVYFITSERFVGSEGAQPRRYTVRRVESSGDINTATVFNQLTRSKAHIAARMLAHGHELPQAWRK